MEHTGPFWSDSEGVIWTETERDSFYITLQRRDGLAVVFNLSDGACSVSIGGGQRINWKDGVPERYLRQNQSGEATLFDHKTVSDELPLVTEGDVRGKLARLMNKEFPMFE